MAANNVHCDDRAAMSMNELYTLWLLSCPQETRSRKETLSILLGAGRTLALRENLTKHLANSGSESVESYLYYEITLREELGLITCCTRMHYSIMGSRTIINDQLDKIKTLVKSEGLAAATYQPAFEKLFEEDQDAQQRLKAIKEPFLEEFNALFENPALKEGDRCSRSQTLKQSIAGLEANFKKEWFTQQLEREGISFV